MYTEKDDLGYAQATSGAINLPSSSKQTTEGSEFETGEVEGEETTASNQSPLSGKLDDEVVSTGGEAGEGGEGGEESAEGEFAEAGPEQMAS
jgi:hypothetical protein